MQGGMNHPTIGALRTNQHEEKHKWEAEKTPAAGQGPPGRSHVSSIMATLTQYDRGRRLQSNYPFRRAMVVLCMTSCEPIAICDRHSTIMSYRMARVGF